MALNKFCVDHILLVQWIFPRHVGHEYTNAAVPPQKMVINWTNKNISTLPEKYQYQVHMTQQSNALLVGIGTKRKAILFLSMKFQCTIVYSPMYAFLKEHTFICEICSIHLKTMGGA